MHRLQKAVTRAEQRRDEIEMESINRILSPLVPARAPATRATPIGLTTRAGFRSILYVNDPPLITAAGSFADALTRWSSRQRCHPTAGRRANHPTIGCAIAEKSS
jgi:hypothetical protein